VAEFLSGRGLQPTSEAGIGAETFAAAVRELERAGLLEEGHPGYRDARELKYGYMFLGTTTSGRRVLIVATHGGQVSNDHYPYYEASFELEPSGGLRLLEYTKFYYDNAGVEGCNAVFFSMAVCVVLSVACLMVYRFIRRRHAA
jgi:hypothetical protein